MLAILVHTHVLLLVHVPVLPARRAEQQFFSACAMYLPLPLPLPLSLPLPLPLSSRLSAIYPPLTKAGAQAW